MNLRVFKFFFHIIFVDLLYSTSDITDVDLGDVKSEYFGNLCSRTVIVHGYLDLDIKFLHSSWKCSVEFVPMSEKNILKVFFRKYESSPSCSGPIFIYNSLNKSLLGENGHCKKESPSGYFHLEKRGTICIAKGGSSIDALVRLVEYSIKETGCPSDSFDCETKNLCISKEIECDFISDCPNGKDEANDCAHDKLVPVYILAGVIVVVCTCCICGMIVWEESHSRRKGKDSHVVHHQMPPGPFDSVYIPSFAAHKSTSYHSYSPKLEEVNAQLAKLNTYKNSQISQDTL